MAKKIKIHGLFGVNKPRGLTSVELLEFINKVCRAHAAATRSDMTKRQVVKLGHGGTLDPMASGVLVVGVNDGTKELHRLLECDKTYEAVGLLGVESDTLDSEGKVTKKESARHVTKEKLLAGLKKFHGVITQVPPLYAAIQLDGKRLYQYARAGQSLPREIPSRRVVIRSLDLLDFQTHHSFSINEKANDENVATSEEGRKMLVDVLKEHIDHPIFKIRVECSSGTYIRALIRDIAKEVGSVATTVELLRTRTGEFELGNKYTLEMDQILDFDNIYDALNDHNRRFRELLRERALN